MVAVHKALWPIVGVMLLALSAPARASNFVYPDASLWHEVVVSDEGDYAIGIVFAAGSTRLERQRITAMLTRFRDEAPASATGAGGVPAYFTVAVNRLPSMQRVLNLIVPHPVSTSVPAGRAVQLAKLHLVPGRYEVWVTTAQSSLEMKSFKLQSHLVVAKLDNAAAGAALQLHSPSKPCSAETDEFRKNVCHQFPRR
ncbi:hypothetical protein [Massilia sp. TWP1-3-3]|uniref:hypothetical protein n=1 Tax=Massilia sp. TWP1-3-3 TaxID=2804573 RepID=UPI003CF7DB12